ncbi:hypothetical protein DFH09DRAFT_1339531 [Mycena vulgaris]|nr:hypothetical protein DFH09DRAFT_1339531 [Mycena vulgaris]
MNGRVSPTALVRHLDDIPLSLAGPDLALQLKSCWLHTHPPVTRLFVSVPRWMHVVGVFSSIYALFAGRSVLRHDPCAWNDSGGPAAASPAPVPPRSILPRCPRIPPQLLLRRVRHRSFHAHHGAPSSRRSPQRVPPGNPSYAASARITPPASPPSRPASATPRNAPVCLPHSLAPSPSRSTSFHPPDRRNPPHARTRPESRLPANRTRFAN